MNRSSFPILLITLLISVLWTGCSPMESPTDRREALAAEAPLTAQQPAAPRSDREPKPPRHHARRAAAGRGAVTRGCLSADRPGRVTQGDLPRVNRLGGGTGP